MCVGQSRDNFFLNLFCHLDNKILIFRVQVSMWIYFRLQVHVCFPYNKNKRKWNRDLIHLLSESHFFKIIWRNFCYANVFSSLIIKITKFLHELFTLLLHFCMIKEVLVRPRFSDLTVFIQEKVFLCMCPRTKCRDIVVFINKEVCFITFFLQSLKFSYLILSLGLLKK